jgi:molybdate transport system substrate-binding protein
MMRTPPFQTAWPESSGPKSLRVWSRLAAVGAGWFLVLAACGDAAGSTARPASASTSPQAPAEPHRVVVFANASLRRAFTALARRYEKDHPGATVELRCEGGAQLLAAMNGGAVCDVVAIGDSSLMSRFAGSAFLAPGHAAELARSRVAIVVPQTNAKGVRTLADLKRPDVRLALGARTSSIGRHGRWVLSRLPGEINTAVEANTADGVRDKVAQGEADAGIVYTTTFADADARVQRIDIPEEANTPALYSIALTRESKEPRGGAAFMAMALGEVGRQVLAEAGFLVEGGKAR